jgi:hypothetical protein
MPDNLDVLDWELTLADHGLALQHYGGHWEPPKARPETIPVLPPKHRKWDVPYMMALDDFITVYAVKLISGNAETLGLGAFLWADTPDYRFVIYADGCEPASLWKLIDANEECRRENLGYSIGPVWGEARPKAKGYKLKARGLSQTERKSLIEKMYPPYLVIPALAPPTREGPDGAYLVQGDRRKFSSCSGSDDQSERDAMPQRASSGFANIFVPHAVHRETTEEDFARRLKTDEAKRALEKGRKSSTAMEWAILECLVKGRRPSEVIEGREEELCLNTLKSHVQRIRRKVKGPAPRKVLAPPEPIGEKLLCVDGEMYVVKVYPPFGRKGYLHGKPRNVPVINESAFAVALSG